MQRYLQPNELKKHHPDQFDAWARRLLMGMNVLNSGANRVERRMVRRICTTLERMLKKLLAQNELCGPSMLNAAALALDLIEEFSTCAGTVLDLISQSNITKSTPPDTRA